MQCACTLSSKFPHLSNCVDIVLFNVCFGFTGADGHLHEFDNNADVIYDYTVLGLTRDKNNELSMFNRII